MEERKKERNELERRSNEVGKTHPCTNDQRQRERSRKPRNESKDSWVWGGKGFAVDNVKLKLPPNRPSVGVKHGVLVLLLNLGQEPPARSTV